MWLLNVVFIVLAILLSAFYFVKHKYSYWERKGVAFIKPKIPYGNMNGPNAKEHSAILFQKYYEQLKGKGPFAGIYLFLNPLVFATDLEFIKNIFVKDFNYFMNRGLFHNEKDDPLTGHLFNIENQKWRDLRTKMTPTFTSGKMKYMFPTIIKVAEELKTCLTNEIKISSEIEMKELLARFTTDVIGTCAFGLDCNSLKDPNAKFREMGRKVFTLPRNARIKILFMTNYPNLSKKLHFKTIRDDVTEFFMNAVRDTIEYREKHNVKNNDFMDLLIQLKNQEEGSLSFEELAAQAFVFFLAGFETSSTAMSFALYELSINQEIQTRARQEVQTVLNKHNGEFTYDAMLEMKYIEQIINESLRKYPPVSNLIRKVTKDYTDSISGTTIPKGLTVFVPVYAIHHDPEYYPNPEEFNPDRFTEGEIHNRNPYTFLPFGEGPRNCIGLRFGMMQARIGLATILLNFKFQPSQKLKVPLAIKPNSFILASDCGLFLNVEKIK